VSVGRIAAMPAKAQSLRGGALGISFYSKRMGIYDC
jgi:hypothetical protein